VGNEAGDGGAIKRQKKENIGLVTEAQPVLPEYKPFDVSAYLELLIASEGRHCPECKYL
jgi:hypothetical protein